MKSCMMVTYGMGGHILTLFNLFQLLAGEVSRFHEFKQNLVAKFRLLQVRASFFTDLSLVDPSLLQSFPDSVLCLWLSLGAWVSICDCYFPCTSGAGLPGENQKEQSRSSQDKATQLASWGTLPRSVACVPPRPWSLPKHLPL